MTQIDELTFGSMIVEGKRCRPDVLIYTDGTEKKKQKDGLRERI